MSDIITTLHPENDENSNLYPNIKKENIPNESIDRSKLDSNVNALLNNIGELHPSGTTTSTNLPTSNQGILIATDNGYWYYWNGTQYVAGGVYLADNTKDAYLTLLSENAVENKVITESITKANGVNPDLINGNKIQTINEHIESSEITFTDGYYINSNNGNLIASADNCYTSSIFIPSGCKVKLYGIGGNLAGATYDENDVYQGGLYAVANANGYLYRYSSLQTLFVSNGEYIKLNLPIASKYTYAIVLEYDKTFNKKLEWLKIDSNNIDNTPNDVTINIAKTDGTAIIPYIQKHLWNKNGTLYTAYARYGSTETIPLMYNETLKILPLFEYNTEGAFDNGAFVNEDGSWFASIMDNATWDDNHEYLNVTVPEGAYGIQLNAAYVDGGYQSGRSRSIYVILYDSKIEIKWLINNVSSIEDGSITISKLSNDVKNRLMPEYDDTYKYWDMLNKPFNFENNKLVAFGDSITYGVANEGSGAYNVTNHKFISLFARKFNMTLINNAVSGACIAAGSTIVTPICDTIDNYTFDNTSSEFIFIAGGINDCNSNRTLGVLGDTTTDTFYGALDHICQRLTSVAPNSTVIFITPINVNNSNLGINLNKYRNAIWEVATKYKYNVVDGSTIGFSKQVNTSWGNLMIAHLVDDGIHPTELGHYLYFTGLCNKLK